MPRRQPQLVEWWRLPAQEFRNRYQWDPILFGKEVVDFTPWSLQETMMRSVARYVDTAVPGGQGVGKTYPAAVVALWFYMTRPASVIVTTAPTGPQVKLLLWAYVNTIFKRFILPHAGGQFECLQTMLRAKVSDEWFAVGLSPREDVNFVGFHREDVLVILDEAPGVRRNIADAARTLMTTKGARMLQIGNPTTSSGHFYEACTGKVPGTNVVRMSCLDSPNLTGEHERLPRHVTSRLVTRAWVDARREQWGEDSPLWQARVLGEFPGASISAIIPREWIVAATDRPGRRAEHPRTLGVDVARHGDDRTVYAALIGNELRIVGEDSKRDTMHVAGKTGALCEQLGIEVCCIDASGLGWGPYDRIVERKEQEPGFLRRCEIVAVEAGKASTHPDLYPNLRSELWFTARDAFDPEHGMGISLQDHESLKEDLSAPEFGYDSKSRRVAEDKDAMRKRLGRSPDYADAANLAVWAAQEHGYAVDLFGGDEEPSARSGQAYRPRVATAWNRRAEDW